MSKHRKLIRRLVDFARGQKKRITYLHDLWCAALQDKHRMISELAMQKKSAEDLALALAIFAKVSGGREISKLLEMEAINKRSTCWLYRAPESGNLTIVLMENGRKVE